MSMDIVWDPNKARINKNKHKISFSDVEPIFYDPNTLSYEDGDSINEQRFIATGSDALGRIITVVYAYRNNQIRLISARRASKQERCYYEKKL